MEQRKLPRELKSLLQELTRQIYIGRTYLLMWENLYNYLVENRDVEKMSPAFLGLTLIAHKDEALLYLSRLYDKPSGAATLDLLAKQAGRYAGLSVDRRHLNQNLDKWESQKKDLERKVEKLRDHRDKFLAHIDKERILNPTPVSEDEKLTLGMVRNLYEVAADFVNAISSAFTRIVTSMEIEDWRDFESLLNNAKLGHKAQLKDIENKLRNLKKKAESE